MDILVIGSGIAGLTAAAKLSQAGHSVMVMEQAKFPGGVTASFTQDGYRWDLGQLLIEGLGRDEPAGRVLAEVGVLDAITVKADDRGYVFPDFEVRKPSTFAGLRWRMEQLARQFPEESGGLDRYWQDYIRFSRVTTLARRSEQARGLNRLAGQAKFYAALLPLIGKKDWSAERLVKHYFKSERLQVVFISILADFFTPPSKFPGLYVFALNAETTFDCRMDAELAPGCIQLYQYSVLGGIGSLARALVQRIEECGGKLLCSRPIRQVVVEGGRACGVVDADGQAPGGPLSLELLAHLALRADQDDRLSGAGRGHGALHRDGRGVVAPHGIDRDGRDAVGLRAQDRRPR